MATPADLDPQRNRMPADRLSFMERQIKALTSIVGELTERVQVLENTTHTGRPLTDDLGERVLTWMREYPGLRVTALIVSEALGADNMKVGTRMATLAGSGKIQSDKQANRTRFYWYEAPAATS